MTRAQGPSIEEAVGAYDDYGDGQLETVLDALAAPGIDFPRTQHADRKFASFDFNSLRAPAGPLSQYLLATLRQLKTAYWQSKHKVGPVMRSWWLLY